MCKMTGKWKIATGRIIGDFICTIFPSKFWSSDHKCEIFYRYYTETTMKSRVTNSILCSLMAFHFCVWFSSSSCQWYVSMCSSRYQAHGKFGEHKRCIRVARGVAKSNSSFLSALQTSQVLHISMNAQLMGEPIVL